MGRGGRLLITLHFLHRLNLNPDLPKGLTLNPKTLNPKALNPKSPKPYILNPSPKALKP